ncbi:hypothetical protein AVEN_207196-1 [Araneus ventricosus]|uniref:Uncharacterized protein n=1 Tax=Araneus ventricosus TaxID=182803 RepID=A0A4Y2MRC3_ARAVE|nr:hypothetical protein AVEN_24084-1 [Araneus ventricosus]GBN29684.1 hypothetical protein AVEN_51912-1 [Araneus ventricosus]GBN29701.1 hypothetical protein AVEN_156738-1 [Araneus ventricosus]GBN29714.1 hypothetical protein AVEN_207196-1 [Araneus ventricosus]
MKESLMETLTTNIFNAKKFNKIDCLKRHLTIHDDDDDSVRNRRKKNRDVIHLRKQAPLVFSRMMVQQEGRDVIHLRKQVPSIYNRVAVIQSE